MFFDFVLAFNQYGIDVGVLMELPLVLVVYGNKGERVPKLNKLMYVLKKESENQFDLIKIGIDKRGYNQYQFYPCVFYRKNDSY